LQSLGFAKNAPPTFPGLAATQRLAAMGVPAAEQYKMAGAAGALDSVYPGRGPAAGTPAVPGASTSTAAPGVTRPAPTFPAGPGAPAESPVLSGDTQARATAVHDGMVKRGWSDTAAWGFAANAVQESSALPNPPAGDGGRSHGLFQWNGDRLAAFQAKYGVLPGAATLDQQLDFANDELGGSEKGSADAIRNATTPGQAAAVISAGYLRPRDVAGEQVRRAGIASRLTQGLDTGGVAAPPAPALAARPPNANPLLVPPGSVPAQTAGLVVPPGVTPPPGVAAPAVPAVAAPAAAAAAPALPPVPPAPNVDAQGLTPQDHTAIEGLKAALRRTGNPNGPQLLQAEIDRRATANVAATTANRTALVQQAEFNRNVANDRLAEAQRQFERGRQTEADVRAAADEARKAADAAQKAAQVVRGDAIEAQQRNTLQTLAARKKRGETLSEEEETAYDDAYTALQQTGGQPVTMTDPNNPGRQIPAMLTRRLPASLPEPRGGALPLVMAQPGAGKPEPQTEAQTKAATWADRLAIANPLMDKLDNTALTWAQTVKEKAGNYAGYSFRSPDFEALRTAQKIFLGAILHSESGAAATDSEWEQYKGTYFPQPGEAPETIKLKQEFRKSVWEGMQRSAGSGYKLPKAETSDMPPPPAGYTVVP